MIYMLDSISKRYKLLPSECISRASTFDIYVMNMSLSYETYLQERGQGRLPVPKLTQDEMLKRLNKVKQRGNKSNAR